MKKIWILLLAGTGLCIALLTGCSIQNSAEQDYKSTGTGSGPVVSIVNWNIQTFFDANKSGFEYSDFQKSGNWSSEKYTVRLQRLGQAISQLDADIYVFEEIENEEVIYDISNQLAANGHNWNQRKFWNYSVFVKEPETAIGIGILSRYPLSNITTHSFDVRIHETSQPATRYILEATASIEAVPLIIFANHWKSKTGGQEKSEIWRDWQENILAKRLAEIKKQNADKMPAAVICGDFNRDAAEFVCNLKNQPSYTKEEQNTYLRFSHFGYTDYLSVDSLWFSDSGTFVNNKGSYYYDDSWERIDNIFITGEITAIRFEPAAVSPWASAQGIPIGYKIYSGEGWSDHLPVAATLVLSDKK